MSSSNAVFVGDGSLLIQCADAYRQAGHSISAIATHSRNILEWAEKAVCAPSTSTPAHPSPCRMWTLTFFSALPTCTFCLTS